MSATKALLDDIAKFQVAQDAAGLKALEDHDDKQVRKAARRAIHVLRSKGVEIPEQGRSWAKVDIQSLRQHAGPIAMLDMAASPGVSRLTLSLPNAEEGAALLIGLLDPTDRMLDFAAYYQTDGQQSRTARDWMRDAEGRSLPVSWVQARLFWAREQTHKRNLQLPRSLDEQLPKLGAAPSTRPEPSFLDEALASVEPASSDLGEILMSGAVHTWPVLFDANALFDKLGTSMSKIEDPSTITEADRLSHIMSASKGDEGLRTGLRGPLANALDDVAVVLYLDGSLAESRRVRDLASQLRGADEPELVDGVVNVVQLQITSAAMEQMRQQQGQGFDHDHDHDHDHGHVHDENCDHDHD